MSGRNLPPLLAGASYRCPPLGNIEFTAPDIARELKGEATATLRLQLANGTELAVPMRAFQLQMLMGSLMKAFPQQALVQLRLCVEEEESNHPDTAQGQN